MIKRRRRSLIIILSIVTFATIIHQAYAQNTLMTTVTDCLTKCAGKTFCPTSNDKKGGYCCTNANLCPRDSSLNYCTSDFKNSTTLQQFMCPFESYCGTSSQLIGKKNSQFLIVSNVTSSNQLTLFPSNGGGMCSYRFTGPSNMTDGDAIIIKVETAYQVTFDFATAPLSNLSQTSSEQKSVATGGTLYRLSYPDQLIVVAKSSGSGTSFVISYQYIAKQQVPSPGQGIDSSQSEGKFSPIIYIMMGAGAMFGIISILALIIWGLCKIFNKKRVAPENMMTEDPQNFTTQSQPLNYRKIPIPFSEADTKIPSAESQVKRNQVTPAGGVLNQENISPKKTANVGDQSVKVVKPASYEPLEVTPQGDRSVKIMPNEQDSIKKMPKTIDLSSPGDDLALIKKQIMAKKLKEEQTPKQPLISSIQLNDRKASVLNVIHKHQEEAAKSVIKIKPMLHPDESNGEEEEEQSQWETSQQSKSEWASSSAAYSSWSKAERAGKPGKLAPLDTSVLRNKIISPNKVDLIKPTKVESPDKPAVDINIANQIKVSPTKPSNENAAPSGLINLLPMVAPSDSENISPSPSPGKKKRLKKKKTKKANKLQSEYEQQSESAAGGEAVSELENQLNAIQSRIGGANHQSNIINKLEVNKQQQQPLQLQEPSQKIQGPNIPIQNSNFRNEIEIGANQDEDDEQSVVNPFAPEIGVVKGAQRRQAAEEDKQSGDEEEMGDQMQLQKKGTSPNRGAKKKSLFKNNQFLGFDFNKSIDQTNIIEPRKFQKLESKYEKKFNGFD